MDGIAILTYNRSKNIAEILEAVLETKPTECQVVVCDDGSTDNTLSIVRKFPVTIISGINMGVGANKNRALYALQDSTFIALLEDDIIPKISNWFDVYRDIAIYSGISHFCRVQNQRPETVENFGNEIKAQGVTPVYGAKPRGDFVFITKEVIKRVGGFNPLFKGAGFAHIEWQSRIIKAGLVPHPNQWVDLRDNEHGDYFEQIGDTEGGRWNEQEKVEEQIKCNRLIYKESQKNLQIFQKLCLP